MSPFSKLLHDLRIRHGVRQADLAEALGYEQSYISALELGIKGPPTEAFIDKLIQVFDIPAVDQESIRTTADASVRKLVIDHDSPSDIYWLLRDLRSEVDRLSPHKVKLIRDLIHLQDATPMIRSEPAHSIKRRRKKEEAKM